MKQYEAHNVVKYGVNKIAKKFNMKIEQDTFVQVIWRSKINEIVLETNVDSFMVSIFVNNDLKYASILTLDMVYKDWTNELFNSINEFIQ